MRVLGRDVIDLAEVALLDERELDVAQHVGRVLVGVHAGVVVHDTAVQLARLVVLGQLALVAVVRFAGDDVIRDLVRRLGGVGAEFVLEAVGHVLRVAGVIAVDAHGAVEVEGGVGGGHERAVDWGVVSYAWKTAGMIAGLGSASYQGSGAD